MDSGYFGREGLQAERSACTELGCVDAEEGPERLRSRSGSRWSGQGHGQVAVCDGGIQVLPAVDQEVVEQGSDPAPQRTAAVPTLERG